MGQAALRGRGKGGASGNRSGSYGIGSYALGYAVMVDCYHVIGVVHVLYMYLSTIVICRKLP